ncbi:GNAT family N-acetyltransferase [Amycolatopsis cihanbeyliensis]|uniref:RimJ/RimL family protein N-acetyltransferase n=1 Tax=Amycolatopsis cihanbeyliensis TaxID=1128664 RepID=A0A542DRT9_AMYCI|nr:GNAT family N-acetyltransferase [Amycolatopsis cihanbeyliensis]TQJ05694.1 RimJ/RimL family protein N-acetyltransferase [Amycolatopsis cihanbeyliensis]
MIHTLRDIRTERLLLRRIREDDLSAVIEIQTDPATHEHGGPPPSEEEARTLFAEWRRQWAEHGLGYWMVEESASGTVIGLGGVRYKEIEGETILNLAYRFRPSAWGNGYAMEMAAPTVEWAERELAGTPVVIVTNPGNTPARRVADKLGFRLYREGPYREGGKDVPAVFYRK